MGDCAGELEGEVAAWLRDAAWLLRCRARKLLEVSTVRLYGSEPSGWQPWSSAYASGSPAAEPESGTRRGDAEGDATLEGGVEGHSAGLAAEEERAAATAAAAMARSLNE